MGRLAGLGELAGLAGMGAAPREIGAVPCQMGAVPCKMGAVPCEMGAVPCQMGAVPCQMGAVPCEIGCTAIYIQGDLYLGRSIFRMPATTTNLRILSLRSIFRAIYFQGLLFLECAVYSTSWLIIQCVVWALSPNELHEVLQNCFFMHLT